MPYANSTTTLLGLANVLVGNVIETNNFFTVEVFTEPKPRCCPHCKTGDALIHGYRMQKVKDLPLREKPVYLLVKKRRYRCRACRKTFFERYDFLPKYHHMTRRVYTHIINALRKVYAMKDVASRYNVSTNTVTRVFSIVQHAPSKLPAVLSLDEFKGNSGGNKYHLIITNPLKRKVLDILPSREKAQVFRYFMQFKDRERVKFVIMDMWEPYYDLAKLLFPNAVIIIDKYHYIRQITWAFENVRKARQKQFSPQQRLTFKRSKKLLTSNYDTLNPEQQLHIRYLIEQDEKIFNAWQLKELFIKFRHSKDSKTGATELHRFLETCREAALSEFIPAMTALKNWETPILNSLDYPYTNGFTEGTNNKIKVLKRNAFGYRNFQRFRNRILHVCAH